MIFMELNRSLIETIEKIIRYHYHVSLLCTYVKFNKILKGFRLRFYSSFIDCDYDNILKTVPVNICIALCLIIKKD